MTNSFLSTVSVLLGLLAGLGAHAADSADTKPALSLADLDKIASLSSLAVSPDGKLAALIVSRPDYASNTRLKSLALVDSGGAQHIVATGEISAPAFSPRNDALAWLQADHDGTEQIAVLSLGASTEVPRVVTRAAAGAGVQEFAWSPDGMTLAYSASDTPHPASDASRFNRTFEVADSDYLGTSVLARNAGAAPARLWVMPAAGGDARMLNVIGTVRALAWMPDGRTLAVSTQPGSSDVASRSGAVAAIRVGEGRETPLVATTAKVSPGGRFSVSARGLIGYQHFHGEDPWTFSNRVAVLENGVPREVTVALDRDVSDFAWLPGEAGLLVEAPDHLRVRLWEVALSGGTRPIDLDQLSAADVAVSKTGAVFFVGSEPQRPPELYVLSSLKAKPVRLTNFNQFIAQRNLGALRSLTWHIDGFDHEGILTYPPGFRGDRKYPLLVNIHGGPEYSAQLAWNFESQFYAANGWIVFEPNYRGSNDQGEKYETAVIGDATAGPGRDIRAGLDAVRVLPGVDTDRIAVTGYSYGGVMTLWLIGHHQDWCAAIPGGVVVDFIQYYDQSETGIWINTLLGSPHVAQNRAKYIQQSPTSYLDKAKTPTLILQNAGDPNATVGQAYALYHALKDNGVKAKLLVSDLEGHSSPDPYHERQVFQLTLGWMNENCGAP
jgi:dipeptidyl aminopeptidase/acylaminoacyl peptidase